MSPSQAPSLPPLSTLTQVAAYTSGRGRLAEYDCLLLRHVLWQRPDEAERIYDWLLRWVLAPDVGRRGGAGPGQAGAAEGQEQGKGQRRACARRTLSGRWRNCVPTNPWPHQPCALQQPGVRRRHGADAVPAQRHVWPGMQGAAVWGVVFWRANRPWLSCGHCGAPAAGAALLDGTFGMCGCACPVQASGWVPLHMQCTRRTTPASQPGSQPVSHACLLPLPRSSCCQAIGNPAALDSLAGEVGDLRRALTDKLSGGWGWLVGRAGLGAQQGVAFAALSA